MAEPTFIPFRHKRLPPEQMRARAERFFDEMDARRSIRHFSPDPVPLQLIELAISTASTAPSGAHRQPWRFVAVSDPSIKRQIRVAAEKEELAFYEKNRATPEWLDAVAPLGTNWQKTFLETAPWLVAVFEQVHGYDDAGEPRKNYYVKDEI